jgi:hypothetical protein
MTIKRFFKIVAEFFAARCPECGNHPGTTKGCNYCDEHRADMQTFQM